MFRDIGGLVGRYFQASACVSLMGLLISALFFDQAYFDFSAVLFFWLGSGLVRHQRAAWKWAVGGLILCLMVVVFLVFGYVFFGPEGFFVRLGPIQMVNPSPGPFALVGVVLTGFLLVPLALLLTPKAKAEFSNNSGVVGKEGQGGGNSPGSPG